MTCIVGIVDRINNEIIIGGDSAGVGGLDIVKRKDVKVFNKDDKFLIGFTSSFRMGQILHYCDFNVEEQSEYEDDLSFMIRKFVPSVQKLFKEHEWSKRTNDGESKGGIFIVGYKNNIYKIESDFQVGLSHKDYESCGCGESYALGSLYTSENLTPEDRVMKALETAAEFSAGVCAPFNIVKMKF